MLRTGARSASWHRGNSEAAANRSVNGGLGLRELEYAMSDVGSTPLSHRIGVLMTPEGRFPLGKIKILFN